MTTSSSPGRIKSVRSCRSPFESLRVQTARDSRRTVPSEKLLARRMACGFTRTLLQLQGRDHAPLPFLAGGPAVAAFVQTTLDDHHSMSACTACRRAAALGACDSAVSRRALPNHL